MQVKSDGLKKNFIYQLLYQVIILVLPLFSAPYLTRVLGKPQLGVYSYINSIAWYFVIFAMLGIARHGQRILVARKNDDVLVRKTFWSLFFVHSLFSMIALISYMGFCAFQVENQDIYLIHGILVLSGLFDITWLFYTLERFKSVVIKNGICKILETVLIFTLIKSKDDLWIYTVIMSSSTCIGMMSLLPQAIKWVKPIKFSISDVKEHIKPLFVLSITIIAVTLYTVFDKTLIGIMASKEDVALYDYSDKIIKIPKTIIGVIGTVMFPRACLCAASGDYKGLKQYLNSSISFSYFMGFASIFGLLAVGDLFAVEYYGEEFAICGSIMQMMSPLIIIVTVGDILRTQILIPIHKDKEYTICVILNALLNIGLSVALIPILGPFGAVVGTLGAESVGLVIQLVLCRKYVDFKAMVLSIIPYAIAGALMFGGISILKIYINGSLVHLIIQVGVGALIYFFVLAGWFILISPNRKNYRNKIIRIKNKILHRTIEEPTEINVEQNDEDSSVESKEEKELF